jgi:DNA polymerase-1
LLFNDNPARITSPGTHSFAEGFDAVYTIGRDHVQPALASVFRQSRDVSADIETFGLGMLSRRIKCVVIGNSHHAVIFDPRDPYQANLIAKAFNWAQSITFHHSPFDVPSLYMNGLIDIEDVQKVLDTLIWSRLAFPDERVRKSLEDAVARHIPEATETGKMAQVFRALGYTKKDGFYTFDLDRLIYRQGAASDVIMTDRLKPIVRQAAYDRLTSNHPFSAMGVDGSEAWALVDREQAINAKLFLPRTCKGIRVDQEYLDRYQDENELDVLNAETALQEAGLRPGNRNDLAKMLDESDALPPGFPRTAKTNAPQMTEKTLALVSNSEIVAMHLKYVGTKKVRDDYLKKVVDLMDDNGNVHPQTNLLTASTGRGAMADPPLHQFPGPARGIIVPDVGDEFTSIDISQGEPITIAYAAHDQVIIDKYRSGISDVYTALGEGAGMLPVGVTTSMCDYGTNYEFYKIRAALKVALLAQLYGEGLPKLSADLNLDPGPWTPAEEWEWQVRRGIVKVGDLIPRYAAAKKLRNAVYTGMPKTGEFIGKLKEIAEAHRLIVSISGRIMTIPSVFDDMSGRRRVQAHKGVNYFCQGGQYDLLADAMFRIVEAGLAEAVYFSMHDELIVSSSAAHDIRKIMERPAERLDMWAGQKTFLRTDLNPLGERWARA